MKKDFCVLPCNGLDKFAGSLTREVALKLLENGDHELICPVLYHAAEKRSKCICKRACQFVKYMSFINEV